MNGPRPRTAQAPLIAITGATGFIGRRLVQELPKRGFRVRVLLRRQGVTSFDCASAVIGDLARPQNLSAALADADAIVHSAGLAHAMSGVPDDDYRVFNTEATVALAQAAHRARAKRFIFLSSIRAQSGPTSPVVLTEALTAQPTDPYGHSKLAAEQGLAALDIDWVALRPVLIYGPGVRGNFARLMQIARSRYPLPLGTLTAQRSLLSVDGLVDAVEAVLTAPGPLRQPFIVADATPLTIPRMMAALRAGLNRQPHLLPVPQALLHAGLRLTGKEEWWERLTGSLVVDPSALAGLGWTPRASTETELAALMREEQANATA